MAAIWWQLFGGKCSQEGEDEEEEEVTEEDSKAAVDETLDFDCQEMSHQIAFGSLNHVSCFAHSLQLVMNKFSGITAFQPILKRAFWRQSGKKDLRKQQVSHQESWNRVVLPFCWIPWRQSWSPDELGWNYPLLSSSALDILQLLLQLSVHFRQQVNPQQGNGIDFLVPTLSVRCC